jgi:uncharacterized protein YjdB
MNHKKRIPPYAAGIALICALALFGACGNPESGPSPVPVTGINLDKTSLNLAPNGTYTLIVSYTPADTTETGVTWESDNTAVATVNAAGLVTAVAVGDAVITATSTADNSKTASCTVTVTPAVSLTGINLDRTSLNLAPNGTYALTVSYTPANTTEPGVTWSSSNTTVATVSSGGTVTAVAVGTATITATSTAHSTITAACTVTVVSDPVPLTGISLDKTSLNLIPAGTYALTVSYTPGNTTEPGVTWASSNTDVATVSSGGTVTAVAVGDRKSVV